MLRLLLACCLLTVLSVHAAVADIAIPPPPDVEARAYIVVDFHTNKVLAAHEAVARLEPASLTKLMTAYIVFQELAAGKLKLDEQVTVSEHAWRSEGSRTFIEVGKPVPVEKLILGMIVQSGNDATIALAERIGGTEDTFVQLMNENAQKLGMTGTHYQNSSGLPAPQHYTTARDLSLLAIALIRDFPQYYHWFSVNEFDYNGIRQQNRNGLLGKDPSVDGLKTGHTDSAGFCLVTSAQRDGMRLVSVVLGSTSMHAREAASATLLGYGFTFYDTRLVAKAGVRLASTTVWKADDPALDLGVAHDVYITVPRGKGDALKSAADIQKRLVAPLATADSVGDLRVFAGSQTVATVPLHPLRAVASGSLWRRTLDTVRLWFN